MPLACKFQYFRTPDALRLCRFWPEGRQRLWEEKLHLRRAFAGNAATQWGTVQEDVALSCYTEVSFSVTHRSFLSTMQVPYM